MYNEERSERIIRNLGDRLDSIIQTTIVLNSQGYVVNGKKKCKLNVNDMLLHAFQNINIFDKDQQSNLEHLYYTIDNL